jgi:acyl carrier protein phosphodiesterase
MLMHLVPNFCINLCEMNYLGHALLSFDDPDILTGNMIGDHVKGKLALQQFPERIRMGIELHRSIDAFTDAHPAIARAKVWFRPDYGLYAGALMDSLFDHFLAGDARYFRTEQDLLQFSLYTYQQLESRKEFFPAVFAQYFPYMKEHNWLYGYRTLRGMEKALGGLHRRAQYMPPPEKAYQIFVTHYYSLAQCYFEFIDDMVRFVKIKLTN